MTIQAGTRIELHGTTGVAPERAVICRPRKINLPMRDGYHLVKFADGGQICVHETGFRVLDNR